MTTYSYVTCDVFTDRIFGGNQLAVILDAGGLSDAQMQAIAREFNFAETTFVLPPDDARHTARVRIFTPGRELPFAGHPTIGTAFALATIGRAPAEANTLVLEEAVGPVPVQLQRHEGRVVRCTLTSPRLPELLAPSPLPADLAAVLSLDAAKVQQEVETWSCGVPFVVVPLRDAQAVRDCRLDLSHWRRVLGERKHRDLYVVARRDDGRWQTRMFAPGMGIAEDPATGSAAAAFAGWLAARSLLSDGTHTVQLLQGQEIGRPSSLDLAFDVQQGRICAVRVGGASVLVCRGELTLSV